METQTQTVDLLPEVEAYVEHYIRERVGERYVYHNFQHTYAVVEAAEELMRSYELAEEEKLVVQLAAWFHDTGYAEGWEDHELRGAQLAEAFLREHGAREELLRDVRMAILATRMPQHPQTLVEQIVADADLSHLGQASYWDRCGRIRQEFALTRGMMMSDQEWIDFELGFLLSHEYNTEAARELYGKRKSKHLRQLYKRKKALYPDQTPTNLKELKQSKKNKQAKKVKKKDQVLDDDFKPGRGVETMYRATYRTHVNLSSIADNKANIMLSVNAIILSISAANLIPKLDNNSHLTIPTIILVSVCLGSLFFAIQATRPKVTEGNSSLDDIKARNSNLLFFGNFYNMKLEDFHFGMMEMIRDEEFLYTSMTRDLYYLGVVLAQKYAYLRTCYNIFLYGIIGSVVAFILAALYYNQQGHAPAGHGFFGIFGL